MLIELRVAHLGVIEDVTVLLGPGLTALTGETGAGKTLVVDAIQLLLGGPADPAVVRPGADEATVEGRFVGPEGGEVVLTRIVPARGRSRAYVDGRMLASARLAELGRSLVDVHGQNTHQSLLGAPAQRAALDASAGIDVRPVAEARRRVAEMKAALASLGGDPRARARELDLLRYQLQELESARLEDPDEDRQLQAEEEILADAAGLRDAAAQAGSDLSGDDGAVDRVGAAVAALSGRTALDDLRQRLQGLEIELAEVAREAQHWAETVEDNPVRLIEIGARRQVLTGLRRKYGDTLEAVIAFRQELRERVVELESHDTRAASLDEELAAAEAELSRHRKELWRARTAAAPHLAFAVERHLEELAMPRARFEVKVGDEPGSDAVTWLLGANPGEPVLPLTKVASGGELARTVLAARLATGPKPVDRVAGSGTGSDDEALDGTVDGAMDPDTLVFDEVDAGIGGEAAVAVGRALAEVARGHQVLVVTHLPQVAAFADTQLVVRKDVVGDRTVAEVREAAGGDRVVELSRMLSGSPDSETARRHAAELLATAGSGPDRNRAGSPRDGRQPR